MSTRLKIITPTGTKFDEEVTNIETATVDGRITIGGNIAPMIGILQNCTSYIRNKKGDKREEAIITGGLLYVERGSVKIFTDYFEYKEKLREDYINNDIKKLQDQLKTISDKSSNKYRQLEAALDRQLQKMKALSTK